MDPSSSEATGHREQLGPKKDMAPGWEKVKVKEFVSLLSYPTIEIFDC